MKDDRVEQCLRSCGSKFHIWGPKQDKVRKPSVLRLYCWIFNMRVSEEERSARDGVKTRSSSENWLMITYTALFSALLSRLIALACGSTWVTSFIAFFIFFILNIHRSGVLTALAWLVPHETAAVSAQVLCTPYNHVPCHFMQSHIRKVYACFAVTCHLHFWKNGRDLLRATAVTRGWNGYRKKSQHRKSTLEKKILPPLQQGFEPATFQSRVRRSNHWATPEK